MKKGPAMAFLVVFFFTSLASESFGWHFRPYQVYAVGGVHCWAVQPACWPVLPPAANVPLRPTFATPTWAPPSPTPTHNQPRRGPAVHESRSGSSLVAAKQVARGQNKEGGRCRAGFWNVTGRDLTLTVNGQQHLLRRDRALTLEVERQFTWQRDNQPLNKEQISADRNILEIVLRP